jgi:hypothetical protein
MKSSHRSDGCCLTDERPDGIFGSNYSDLESAQNLPRTSEIAFFMLVTQNLS